MQSSIADRRSDNYLRESALTSAAARLPLSIAPFRYPCHRIVVCSPAKSTRPAGRASAFLSVGLNDVSKKA